MHRDSVFYKKALLLIGCFAAFAACHGVTGQKPTANNRTVREKKTWTCILDVVGNNNLFPFVIDTLTQLANTAQKLTLNNAHIVCQVENYTSYRALPKDIFYKKGVTRLALEKGTLCPFWNSEEIPASVRKDNPALYYSGNAQNLTDFIATTIQNFPADHYMFITWNHGSSVLDPLHWRSARHNSLIQSFGPAENDSPPRKGMSFNDTKNSYISTPETGTIFKTISEQYLNGKKMDIVALDLCNMAQLEVAYELQNYADFIIFSQEVGINFGWNYERVFSIMDTPNLSPITLVQNTIQSYADEYSIASISHGAITFEEFTISAYNTSSCQSPYTLKKNTYATDAEALIGVINSLANHFIACLKMPESNTFKLMIQAIRTSDITTTKFYNDTSIDLNLFLKSIQSRLRLLLGKNEIRKQHPVLCEEFDAIINDIADATELLEMVVPFYKNGTYFDGSPPRARGLSIYFPLHSIHSSYRNTRFAQGPDPLTKAPWFNFLKLFLGREG